MFNMLLTLFCMCSIFVYHILYVFTGIMNRLLVFLGHGLHVASLNLKTASMFKM